MNIKPPRVSVVVPVYNRTHLTNAFLDEFSKVTYSNFEVIIVDDGSTDGTPEMIRKQFPSVRLLSEPGNLWWAKATNIGIRDALGRGTDYVLTINDDVTFRYDFLGKLVSFALLTPNTLVGAMIYEHSHPDRLWYAGGRTLWSQGKLIHRMSLNDGPLLWLTGMGTLIPIEVFHSVGFYDDKHFPQYAADVDFSLRAKAKGFGLAIAPESVVWNKAEESSQLIIRKNVRLGNFFSPLYSLKSDSLVSMRVVLYWRHWPRLLIPVVFPVYYATVFLKQLVRLLRLR